MTKKNIPINSAPIQRIELPKKKERKEIDFPDIAEDILEGTKRQPKITKETKKLKNEPLKKENKSIVKPLVLAGKSGKDNSLRTIQLTADVLANLSSCLKANNFFGEPYFSKTRLVAYCFERVDSSAPIPVEVDRSKGVKSEGLSISDNMYQVIADWCLEINYIGKKSTAQDRITPSHVINYILERELKIILKQMQDLKGQ